MCRNHTTMPKNIFSQTCSGEKLESYTTLFKNIYYPNRMEAGKWTMGSIRTPKFWWLDLKGIRDINVFVTVAKV